MSAGLPSARFEGSARVAALSLDLDNQWSYMKSGGIDGWQDFPSYFEVAVPRILDLLDKHNLRITFFVVGQDAVLEKNRRALKMIADAGHEIANHSFHHEPWLNRQPKSAIAAELVRAHGAIAEATGQVPAGFRGPGFSLSTSILEIIADMGYRYDASTFPTFIGPLARSYYFLASNLDAAQKAERAHLFGTMADGLRSLKPYAWALGETDLMEMPVSTFPGLRMPFHQSYIGFAASFSPLLARTYFQAALAACRLTGIQPSFLLHPLDFLGGEDVPCLKAFPGMKLDAHRKLELMDKVLGTFARKYNVLTMLQHASLHADSPALKTELPHFSIDTEHTGGASMEHVS